ncbi:MAG: molybdopterin-dependent oxidoreductase, partial [Chloroflexi bacterium]|nr:molybdopterin-dependent oxidoreductase [Chloroflexota bacterium]
MQSEPTAFRIADPGIRALFSDDSKYQSWLDVEAALAQSQAELGVIPEYAAQEITIKAQLSNIDIDAMKEGLARTGHPLVPLIWELDKVCEGDAGGYVHWGATTQNITQTGKLLMVQKAHRIFLGLLAQLLTELAELAERTKDMALPGRTHGQHAVPATFGFKVAVWIDELCRHVERLRGCEGRVFVAMLGGGAGTLASLGEIGLTTQDRMAEKLGLDPIELRIKNALVTGDKFLGGQNVDHGTLISCLEAVRRASNWETRRAKRAVQSGKRRGIGVAG